MVLTLLLSAMMMAGMFILLLTAVGLIQDEKFFTSAPEEVQEVVQPRDERFPGAHILGYIIAVLGMICIGGAIVIGAIDGIRNDFTFGQFFIRFIVILLLMKAFDILFFDWVLLCHSNFFPYFYPETKPVLGPHLFGYNKKDHFMQIIIFFIGSAILAWICTLF